MERYEDKFFTYGLIAGTLLMAVPVLFLENELLAGICNVAAVLLFLCTARRIKTIRQLLIELLALWLSQSIRFSSIFGTDVKYMALIVVLFIPVIFLSGIVIVLDNYTYEKKWYVIEILLFPVFYTLLNMAMVAMGLGNMINSMIYPMCLPGLGQNLTWLGEYGMTFVLCLIISIIAQLAVCNTSRGRWICFISGSVLLVGLFYAGFKIKSNIGPSDYSLNVAVAMREKMDFLGKSEAEYTEAERLVMFEDSLKTAAENGADLLVLQEEYFDLKYATKNEAYEAIGDIVRKYKIPTIAGADISRDDGELNINEAVFFDKEGNILCKYDKHNLVPFIEGGNYKEGNDGPATLTYRFGKHEVNLAIVLCFDINDPSYIKDIPQDTELIAVPAWNWDTCNIEQKRMRIRSVERNTTMLHHIFEGFTYASGPDGLCGDYLDLRGEYETVKMIEVPIWEKD